MPLTSVLLVAKLACGADFEPAAQATIVSPNARPELVWSGGRFTEGPTLGPNGVIFFSDIGQRTMRFDPVSTETTVFREPSGRANGLMMDRRGNLIACEGARGGGRRVSLTTTKGQTRTIADRWRGKRFNSPNDLAIDSADRIYFTDPRYGAGDDRELDFEGVFFVAGDEVTLATRSASRPNGILVSIDGRNVFVADTHSDASGNHHLLSFDVRKDGTLTNKQILFDFGPNRRGIDGMTLDEQGNIYATAGRKERSGVYVFSPAGKPLAFVPTGDSPTNCVFGGGKEKSTLYVTARAPRPEDRWGLYRIRLRTRGHHVFE